MGKRLKRAVFLDDLSQHLPPLHPKKRKRTNKQKRETQSDQAGKDDLKKEKGKNKGKITTKMLDTHLDNIKDNQNNDFKKKNI